MFIRHVSAQLAQYADGRLARAEATRIDAHLAGCARCRGELEDVRVASSVLRALEIVSPPASVWNGIAATLDARERRVRPAHAFGHLRLAGAWAVLLLAAGAAYWLAVPEAPAWQVERTGVADARLAPGAWVDTGDGSRARITVGSIGTVEMEPGTRVRLGAIEGDERRLELARGTISAQISAPPRLFFVETPASTVVDLGCAYTITVDEDGGGELHMTQGWSALEWNGRESLVPAGAMCRTRPRVGPGTPYFEDASAALREAVDAFDFANAGAGAVGVILREARGRDTLTLWHLLPRVEEPLRGQVYERIASFTPPPAGVARERVLQLDADALRAWREELAWTW